MGDPKRLRKKYHSPGHPYEEARLTSELVIVGRYGLRNKRELWRARTKLGRYRALARSLLALDPEERERKERILVGKLVKLGIISEGATSDDILGLEVEAFLKRRLQTIVLEKGLAGTIHQARQLIVHRHIALNNQIITAPGYIVPKSEEDNISYAPSSPFNDPNHPLKQSLSRETGLVEIPKKEVGRRNRR